jgi:hypothetical protein
MSHNTISHRATRTSALSSLASRGDGGTFGWQEIRAERMVEYEINALRILLEGRVQVDVHVNIVVTPTGRHLFEIWATTDETRSPRLEVSDAYTTNISASLSCESAHGQSSNDPKEND